MRDGEAEVRLQSPHAAKQFDAAPHRVQTVLRRKAQKLRQRPTTGTPIRISNVPKQTLRRWEGRIGPVMNLYKIDLPDAWRTLYTIGSDGPTRTILILEIVDHHRYDRMLGYA